MAQEKQPSAFEQLVAKMGEAAKKVAEFPSRNMESAPSFMGQMDALRRDAMTDIRDTFNQVFFGQKEGAGAAGMPLAPTQFMVNRDLGTTSFQDMLDQASTVHGKQQERGLER
jgi:hypothetical protein